MTSDYDRWFVCQDGKAIKCKRERFIDFLTDEVGPVHAASLFPQYRKATFTEQCKYELLAQEDR